MKLGIQLPLPLDLASANGATAVVCLTAYAALALYAFRISVGNRPVLALKLDE